MEDQNDDQSKNKQDVSRITALPEAAFASKITETRTFHTLRGSITTKVVGDSSQEITEYLQNVKSLNNDNKTVQTYQSSLF